jgi:SsrA-binding protein
MAAGKAKSDHDHSPRIANRKAFHDYHIDEKLEVGIKLVGSEVKSIRNGQVSLAEGFAQVDARSMELWLLNVDIALYPQSGDRNHEPKRPRKLLAHRREITKMLDRTTAAGTTLIPLAMYFVRGMVKVEIGVASGKQAHDKRQDLKKREAERDIRRHMARGKIG